MCGSKRTDTIPKEYVWADSVYKVWCPYVCLFVPSCGTQNRMDWRLLVKERIARIARLRTRFGLKKIFFGGWGMRGVNSLVSLDQNCCLGQSAYSAWWGSELGEGGCGCWLWLQVTGDMWQVTHDTLHVTCTSGTRSFFLICMHFWNKSGPTYLSPWRLPSSCKPMNIKLCLLTAPKGTCTLVTNSQKKHTNTC